MTSVSESKIFKGTIDRYNGITVDSISEGCEPHIFHTKLAESINLWKKEKIRAVWFKVDLLHSEWVPSLTKQGFVFHHAKENNVTMVKWLPEAEDCNIPVFAHTMIGVGAIVFNSKDQILAVKERFWKTPHWKLPGGYVEPGEDIVNAAIREVLEETNIKAKFFSVVAFRHTHQSQFGCSDIYFIVSLTAESEFISKCDREIDDCQWMKIEEFLNHPHVHEMNRFFVRKFLQSKNSGLNITCEKGLHPVLKKPQCLYSIEDNKFNIN